MTRYVDVDEPPKAYRYGPRSTKAWYYREHGNVGPAVGPLHPDAPPPQWRVTVPGTTFEALLAKPPKDALLNRLRSIHDGKVGKRKDAPEPVVEWRDSHGEWQRAY